MENADKTEKRVKEILVNIAEFYVYMGKFVEADIHTAKTSYLRAAEKRIGYITNQMDIAESEGGAIALIERLGLPPDFVQRYEMELALASDLRNIKIEL
jgi:hypothetical protein